MNARQADVRVLFFSVLREIVGAEAIAWPWPPAETAPTVATLLAELYAKFPGLEKWRARLLVAVDLEYATPDQSVRPGQEVALMPPVQGG